MTAPPDHKAVIAALPAHVRLDLSQTSDWRGLLHLGGHLGLIALTSALILRGGALSWLALPAQGTALVFLFTLEHETTHRTPFARPWLNDWVGRACGLVLLLPFEWFRYFHLAHHKWTNLPGLDPELNSPKPDSARAWAIHVSGLPYWGAQARLIWGLARGGVEAPYLPQGARPRLRAEARVMLALYALALTSLAWGPALFWLWGVPMALGQPFLRLYLLAEHGDAPQVANMLENSRTTFTTALVRFLAWNMPYHAEHHAMPTVPFHALPRLHAAIRGHLRLTAEGYARFNHEYLARRRGRH